MMWVLKKTITSLFVGVGTMIGKKIIESDKGWVPWGDRWSFSPFS